MALGDVADWLDSHSGPGFLWYAKRLSGNDTLANGAHQAGPYMPKELLFRIFPGLDRPEAENPDVLFDLYIDSHPDHQRARAVWYNNRHRGGSRDEARVTRLGGAASALLDPDSTGALAVFAFTVADPAAGAACHVWVCRHAIEEDLVEERIGPVEPGTTVVWPEEQSPLPGLAGRVPLQERSCWLEPHELPPEWLVRFPAGVDLVDKAVELRPVAGLSADERLLKRRDCEFDLFRSLEEATELSAIREGFDTMEAFLAKAQSILQRRKARAGRSLELHARAVFLEEELREGRDFTHQPETEKGHRPDFVFPSAEKYADRAFPETRLRMLAVKTTCKDRWRQVLNEAARIRTKHLLTLQEGVSEGQFREMQEAGVQLVVPAPLVGKFPGTVQPQLLTFESFIGDVRLVGLDD